MKISKKLNRFLAALLSVGMIATTLPQAALPVFAEEVTVVEDGDVTPAETESTTEAGAEEQTTEAGSETQSTEAGAEEQTTEAGSETQTTEAGAEEQTTEAEPVVEKYSITVAENANVTVKFTAPEALVDNKAAKVDNTADVTFTVALTEAAMNDDYELKAVKLGDEVLEPNDDLVYTIAKERITKDLTITVETAKVEMVEIAVNTEDSLGASIDLKDVAKVAKNREVSIPATDVTVEDGFKDVEVWYVVGTPSEANAYVKADLKENAYVVPAEKVTDKITLKAVATKEEYTVTFTTTKDAVETAITAPAEGEKLYYKGTDVKFTVKAKDGYRLVAENPITYKVGDAEAKSLTVTEDGNYTIAKEEVTGNIVIDVKAEKTPGKFDITFDGDYKLVNIDKEVGEDGKLTLEEKNRKATITIAAKEDGPAIDSILLDGKKIAVSNGKAVIKLTYDAKDAAKNSKKITVNTKKEVEAKILYTREGGAYDKSVKDLFAIGVEYKVAFSIKGRPDLTATVDADSVKTLDGASVEDNVLTIKPTVNAANKAQKADVAIKVGEEKLTYKLNYKVEPELTVAGIGKTITVDRFSSKIYTLKFNKLAYETLQIEKLDMTSSDETKVVIDPLADSGRYGIRVTVVAKEAYAKDKAPVITFKNELTGKDALKVTVLTKEPAWTKAKPVIKLVNSTDTTVIYNVTAPSNTSYVNATYTYQYVITYTSDKNNKEVAYTTIVDNKDGKIVDGDYIFQSEKLIEAAAGKGKAAKFTINAKLQFLNSDEQVVAESQTASLTVATKAPSYISKLSVVKTKAANGLYQGDTNKVGDVKFDAKATYIDVEDLDVIYDTDVFKQVVIYNDYSIIATAYGPDKYSDPYANLGNSTITVTVDPTSDNYDDVVVATTNFTVKVLPSLYDYDITDTNKLTDSYYKAANKPLNIKFTNVKNEDSKPQPKLIRVDWLYTAVEPTDPADVSGEYIPGVTLKGTANGATLTIDKNAPIANGTVIYVVSRAVDMNVEAKYAYHAVMINTKAATVSKIQFTKNDPSEGAVKVEDLDQAKEYTYDNLHELTISPVSVVEGEESIIDDSLYTIAGKDAISKKVLGRYEYGYYLNLDNLKSAATLKYEVVGVDKSKYPFEIKVKANEVTKLGASVFYIEKDEATGDNKRTELATDENKTTFTDDKSDDLQSAYYFTLQDNEKDLYGITGTYKFAVTGAKVFVKSDTAFGFTPIKDTVTVKVTGPDKKVVGTYTVNIPLYKAATTKIPVTVNAKEFYAIHKADVATIDSKVEFTINTKNFTIPAESILLVYVDGDMEEGIVVKAENIKDGKFTIDTKELELAKGTHTFSLGLFTKEGKQASALTAVNATAKEIAHNFKYKTSYTTFGKDDTTELALVGNNAKAFDNVYALASVALYNVNTNGTKNAFIDHFHIKPVVKLTDCLVWTTPTEELAKADQKGILRYTVIYKDGYSYPSMTTLTVKAAKMAEPVYKAYVTAPTEAKVEPVTGFNFQKVKKSQGLQFTVASLAANKKVKSVTVSGVNGAGLDLTGPDENGVYTIDKNLIETDLLIEVELEDEVVTLDPTSVTYKVALAKGDSDAGCVITAVEGYDLNAAVENKEFKFTLKKGDDAITSASYSVGTEGEFTTITPRDGVFTIPADVIKADVTITLGEG